MKTKYLTIFITVLASANICYCQETAPPTTSNPKTNSVDSNSATAISVKKSMSGMIPDTAQFDIFSAVSERDIDEVKKLIDNNKSVVNARYKDGKTPLALLVNTDQLSIGGLSPNFQGAMQKADESKDLQVAAILLGAGADINAKDNDGRTPLITAIVDKKVSFAKFLIEKGADVNVVDYPDGGITPLFAAVGHEQVEIIQLLVAKGARLNAQDTDGNTPLHIAALYHYPVSAKTLLQLGADPSIKNKEGQTPLEAAKAKGDNDLVVILSGTGENK